MEEWFKRRLEGFIDNAIFSLLVTGGVVVWSVIKSLPSPIIFVIALAVFTLVLFILKIFRDIFRGRNITPAKPNIEFYRTRQELATNRGSMAEELGDANIKKLWVSWWTGINATANRLYSPTVIKRQPPIDRMILIDPNGEYIKSHITIEDRAIDEIRNEIKHTCELFGKTGVALRFFDGYIEGMVIADVVKNLDEVGFSDGAWVRIEPCVPYKDTLNACNYVVYKKQDRVLFDALVNSYLFLWSKSKQ